MTLNSLGTIKIKKEDYLAAEQYFDELVHYKKDAGWVYIGLGIIESFRKNEEKSRSYFNDAKEDFN